MDLNVNTSTEFLIKLATFLYDGVNKISRNNNFKSILLLTPAESVDHLIQYLNKEGINTDKFGFHYESHMAIKSNDMSSEQSSVANNHSHNDQNQLYVKNKLLCKLMKYLYKAVDIRRRDKYCSTALNLALKNNLICIVECLLARGVSAIESDKKGRSALYYAVKSRSPQLVEMVLSVGVDVNERHGCEAITAVHLAVNLNCADIVQLLTENRADVNIPDVDDITPLSSAMRKGSIDIVKCLLCGGADLKRFDKIGDSPLHEAAGLSAVWVKLLLSKGVDINLRGNPRGWSPLMVAANAGNVSTLLFLLKNRADVHMKNDDMQTSLHWAATGRVVEILFEWGADINTKDITGDTPLHCALDRQNMETIEALLTLGAQVHVQNAVGHTFSDVLNSCFVSSHLKNLIQQLIIKFKKAGYACHATNLIEDREYRVWDVFASECSLEVERMKEVKFGYLSLFNILIKGLIGTNCSFVANPQISEFIQSKQLEHDFPKYNVILRRHFRMAKRRNSLIRGSTGKLIPLLDTVHNVKLPEETVYFILSHLTITELIHLHDALNRC